MIHPDTQRQIDDLKAKIVAQLRAHPGMVTPEDCEHAADLAITAIGKWLNASIISDTGQNYGPYSMREKWLRFYFAELERR